MREAYFRLLLSQVRSSRARENVSRAAAQARSAHAGMAEHHGSAARWAEDRAEHWLGEAPEFFVDSSGLEDGWTWRSALWGVPALAAMFSLVFALITLFSGPGEGQDTLAWVLIPGLLALPVVGAGAVYRHVLGAHGHLSAVLAAGLAVLISIPLITWLVVDALRVSLPPGVPWSWVSVVGFVLLTVVCWTLSRRILGSGADDGSPGPVSVLGSSEPVTDRTWFARFRTALHLRGSVSDREVRRSVDAARERVRSAGATAVEAFGSPWEYAASLPQDPRVGPRRATAGYGALALFWLVLVGVGVVSGDGGEVWTRLVLGALMVAVCLTSAVQWYRAARSVKNGGAPGA